MKKEMASSLVEYSCMVAAALVFASLAHVSVHSIILYMVFWKVVQIENGV